MFSVGGTLRTPAPLSMICTDIRFDEQGMKKEV